MVGSDCVVEGTTARPSPAPSSTATSKARAAGVGRRAARGSVGMGKLPGGGGGGGERAVGGEEEEGDEGPTIPCIVSRCVCAACSAVAVVVAVAVSDAAAADAAAAATIVYLQQAVGGCGEVTAAHYTIRPPTRGIPCCGRGQPVVFRYDTPGPREHFLPPFSDEQTVVVWRVLCTRFFDETAPDGSITRSGLMEDGIELFSRSRASW